MTPQEIRARIDKLKMAAGCQICGYNAHPAALSFDHFNPDNFNFKEHKRIRN